MNAQIEIAVYDANGAFKTAIATVPAHGHTGTSDGGTLNAGSIFSSGVVGATYGGLGANAAAFSGLIKMASGAASVATPGTDYTTPTGTENLSSKTITASSLIATALSLLLGGFKAIFTHSNSADRTYTLPNATGTVLLADNTATVTGKTIDGDDNTVQDLPLTAIKTDATHTKRFLTRDASGVPTDATSPAFDNANHTHQNAAGGGTLDAAAIAAGTLALARGGTGQSAASNTALFNAIDPLTTKGDIVVHNGTDSVRLPVGANGKPLVADSAGTEGVKWGDVPGSVVLVANTFLGSPAANIDLPSISGSYSHLKLILNLRSDVSANTDSVYLRFNNDSTAGDYYSYTTVTFGTGTPTITPTQRLGATATGIEIAGVVGDTATAGYYATLTIDIYNYAHTGRIREIDFKGGYQIGTATGNLRNVQGNGSWSNTADAISRITLVPAAGSNWKADSSYELIGVA